MGQRSGTAGAWGSVEYHEDAARWWAHHGWLGVAIQAVGVVCAIGAAVGIAWFACVPFVALNAIYFRDVVDCFRKAADHRARALDAATPAKAPLPGVGAGAGR